MFSQYLKRVNRLAKLLLFFYSWEKVLKLCEVFSKNKKSLTTVDAQVIAVVRLCVVGGAGSAERADGGRTIEPRGAAAAATEGEQRCGDVASEVRERRRQRQIRRNGRMKRKFNAKIAELEAQLEAALAKASSLEKVKKRLQGEMDDLMVEVDKVSSYSILNVYAYSFTV